MSWWHFVERRDHSRDRAGPELVGGWFHIVVFTVWTAWIQKWANVGGLYRDSWENNGCLNSAKLCETSLTCWLVLWCTEQKLHYFSAGRKYVQDLSGPNVLMDFLCSNSPAAREKFSIMKNQRDLSMNVFTVLCLYVCVWSCDILVRHVLKYLLFWGVICFDELTLKHSICEYV